MGQQFGLSLLKGYLGLPDSAVPQRLSCPAFDPLPFGWATSINSPCAAATATLVSVAGLSKQHALRVGAALYNLSLDARVTWLEA